jgi:patatin-related protein
VTASSTVREPRDLDRGGPTRELRLAVVCYGGVSLAIYMHGVTRELHSLVRASAALDADPDRERNPFADDQTEHAYWQALRDLRDEQRGIRTSVVVDIISGTSAGGINGVVLAKAIARNQSQQTLRDIWFEKADFNQLLRLPSLLPAPVRRLHIGRGRLLLGLRIAASTVWMRPPLAGGRMSSWLYDALRRMPDGERWNSLVPRDGSLELYVTATDLAGFRRFLNVEGTEIQDRTHRRVLRFRHDDGADDFGGDTTTALAFAARVTASFPGAFPPVCFASFHRDVGAPGAPAQIAARFFPSRPGESANDTYLIDGGVLDNFPFEHAIRAITQRPASRQVRRLLLYIEPDPGPAVPPEAAATDAGAAAAPAPPSWLGTIWRATSAIPAHEPVLDALFGLDAFNRRVELVAGITAENYQRVERVLRQDIERVTSERLSQDEARALRDRMQELAVERAGDAYVTYVRLKLREAADYLASLVAEALAYPPESSQAGFLRAVMHAWVAEVRAEERPGFLDRFDRGYRERRLRFIIDGVNQRYPRHEAERPLLDTVKKELYDLLGELLEATSPEALRERLAGLGGDLFLEVTARTPSQRLPSPSAFAGRHRDELGALAERLGAVLGERFSDSGAALWSRFLKVTGGHPDLQSDLLVRYLGFPLWDTMVFPVLALTEVSQFSPIEVARISPEEARRIPPSKRGALRGTALHHFGAFEARADREHDYLCGRLDGVERLLTLLYPATLDERCREGFAAVLAAEKPLLDRDLALKRLVEGQVGS